MKKMLFCMVLALAAAGSVIPSAMAFSEAPPVGIQILDDTAVAALSDEKLIDAYVDVLTEIEARRMLYTTVVFTVKEYNSFKDVIKYRLKLQMEINRRKLETPPAAQPAGGK